MKNNNPTLTVKKVIICDDVRQEHNGKSILIGVHAGDIIVPNFPAIFPLALWLEARIENGNGPVSFEFRFRNLDTGPIAGYSDRTILPPSIIESATFPLPQMSIFMQEKGILIAEMKFGDNDWLELERIAVKAREAR